MGARASCGTKYTHTHAAWRNCETLLRLKGEWKRERGGLGPGCLDLHDGLLGLAVNAVLGKERKLRDGRAKAQKVGRPDERVGQHNVAVAKPAARVAQRRLGSGRNGDMHDVSRAGSSVVSAAGARKRRPPIASSACPSPLRPTTLMGSAMERVLFSWMTDFMVDSGDAISTTAKKSPR